MIATIGTIIVWILIALAAVGGLFCAVIGFMFLCSYTAWKR